MSSSSNGVSTQPSEQHHVGQADWLVSGALFLGALALRLPLASRWLINWDAVQFALGTENFDLVHHQPHPPGYIVYVLWGALLNHFTHDPNTSLVAISIAAGCIAVVILHRWALLALGRDAALAISIPFASSPLLWYYSEVALTYAVEVCFALTVLALLWRSVVRNEDRLVVPASFVLGLAGGVRQSTLLLLFPVWWWTIRRVAPSKRRQAALALALTCTTWLVPLTVLAGGPERYVAASLELAGLVSRATSVVYAGLGVGMLNFTTVVATLLVAMNATLLTLLCSDRRGPMATDSRETATTNDAPHPTRSGEPDRDHREVRDSIARQCTPWERRFALLWVAPAFLVFTLGHIGQPGYVLLILPCAYLALGPRIAALANRMSVRLGQTRSVGVIVLALALSLGNVTVFFGLPELAYHVAPQFAAKADLRENDRYWSRVVALVESYPPDETVVLTGSDPRSSFRHASYYLRDYPVYAIGRDANGRYGYLFRSYQGISDYSIERLQHSSLTLELPSRVRFIFILDREVADSLALPDRTHVVTITDYREIHYVRTSELRGIAFVDDRMYLVSHALVRASHDAATTIATE